MKTFKNLSVLAIAGVMFISWNSNATVSTDPVKIVNEISAPEPVVLFDTKPNIVEVAVGNEAFSTLVAAVKAADLVGTLSSKGPFTVFAPTNDAFAKLPQGTIQTLLLPENKATLTSVLTYHVVAGKFEAAAVIDAIKANKGKFTVKTVQGGSIVLSLKDGKVMLTDEKGGMATVVIADVAASNGVIHALDTVVMPK